MGYICTRCGGTNVACEAIVNPNTGKIIEVIIYHFTPPRIPINSPNVDTGLL